MQYFHFERLIQKYSRSITVHVPADGEYKDGRYESGKSKETKIVAAILSHAKNKQFQPGGSIETQDRILYTLQPIDKALIGAEISFEGNTYQISADRQTGNECFTGVYAYVLRWVSAFNDR